MPKNDLIGVPPQELATDAQGVSLTPPQATFLDSLYDLMLNLGKPGYPTKGNKHCGTWEEEGEVPASTSTKAHARVQELYALGEAASLSEREVDYIREWVINRGLHWLSIEKIGLGEGLEARLVFRNPVVRTIINAASERGMCVGTVASKDEVADYYTQGMRNFSLPKVMRDRSAEGLAKLMGYYPKEGSGGGQTVNVQINCVNPYGTPVDAEVTDEN